jgi:hypothetical protein
MSTSLLYHAWGIHGYRLLHTRFEKGTVRFAIEHQPDTLRCGHCGSQRTQKAGRVPPPLPHPAHRQPAGRA